MDSLSDEDEIRIKEEDDFLRREFGETSCSEYVETTGEHSTDSSDNYKELSTETKRKRKDKNIRGNNVRVQRRQKRLKQMNSEQSEGNVNAENEAEKIEAPNAEGENTVTNVGKAKKIKQKPSKVEIGMESK